MLWMLIKLFFFYFWSDLLFLLTNQHNGVAISDILFKTNGKKIMKDEKKNHLQWVIFDFWSRDESLLIFFFFKFEYAEFGGIC